MCLCTGVPAGAAAAAAPARCRVSYDATACEHTVPTGRRLGARPRRCRAGPGACLMCLRDTASIQVKHQAPVPCPLTHHPKTRPPPRRGGGPGGNRRNWVTRPPRRCSGGFARAKSQISPIHVLYLDRPFATMRRDSLSLDEGRLCPVHLFLASPASRRHQQGRSGRHGDLRASTVTERAHEGAG
jgi:hypothetical protein